MFQAILCFLGAAASWEAMLIFEGLPPSWFFLGGFGAMVACGIYEIRQWVRS